MSSDEQLARSQLRCGFIEVIKSLKGRKAEIVTCEGNTLDCNFIGVDRSVENIAVENLRTPTNSSLPQAIIRTQDTDKVKLV